MKKIIHSLTQEIFQFFSEPNTKIFILVLFLALFVRTLMIYDGQFLWWYDQGRDAVIANEIWHGDIKIQGPSASGTNDLLYHGVLYYYLIAPLYGFFAGNPSSVSFALIMISTTLSMYPIYVLSKKIISNQHYQWIPVFLSAISLDSASYASWLSNPILAFMALPWLWLALWHISMDSKLQKRWYFVATLSLAITHQATLYGLFWTIPVIIIFLYRIWKYKSFMSDFKHLVLSGTIYFIGISTMILNEFLLYKNGVLTIAALKSIAGTNTHEQIEIQQIINLYIQKTASLFNVHMNWLGALLLILAFLSYFFLTKKSKKIFVFLVLWILSPIFLLSIIFRNSVHILVGIETPIFILTSLLFVNIIQKINKPARKFLFVLFVFIIVINTSRAIIKNRSEKKNIFAVQSGSLFSDHIDVISSTYRISEQQPFSIALLGNPLGYQVTWAYLYDWYGTSHYGYKPTWFGPDQIGLVGAKLLQKNEVMQNHFAIVEPDVFVSNAIREDFFSQQIRATIEQISEQQFGKTSLYYYKK